LAKGLRAGHRVAAFSVPHLENTAAGMAKSAHQATAEGFAAAIYSCLHLAAILVLLEAHFSEGFVWF